MARRPRIKLAGVPQHIVQRKIDRESCFFADEDYFSYLHWLKKSGCRLALCHTRLCTHDQPRPSAGNT